MSELKRTITLAQNTPIIHFQHDHAGATLRATEVKSKLDKFIIKDLARVCPDIFLEYRNLINKYNFPLEDVVAAPYKISIKGQGNPDKYIIKPTFGNNDDTPFSQRLEASFFGDSVVFQGVFFPQGVSVEVFSFVPRMAEFIEKVLPYLFAVNNFGCRQSKGFGCYSAIGEEYDFNWVRGVWERYSPIKGVYGLQNTPNGFQEQLKRILEDYQILKSGRNHGGYLRSKLFEYALPMRWEKRKIKQFLYANQAHFGKQLYSRRHSGSTPEDLHSFHMADPPEANYDYRFIRAMLGLAEQHEYLVERKFFNQKLNKEEVKPDNRSKYVVSFEHQPSTRDLAKIERFQSPLIYKIYRNQLFILVHEIPQRMFNQPFRVKVALKGGSKPSRALNPDIFTPSNFNILEFLDFKLDNGYIRYK